MVKGLIMRFLFFLIFTFVSFSVFGQITPPPYLSGFDAKIYSLKTKGIKEFTVDLKSPKLTKQISEQLMIGKIDDLAFRVYWTASPERFSIEVLGMPEGFREVKEELKMSITPMMDFLIPQTVSQRFAGYKFAQGTSSREYSAVDSTGIAAVPGYTLKFDVQDRLLEIIGKKPIGSLSIVPKYEKTPFSDGKWVLQKLTTTNSENGQTMTSIKELTYGTANGIGVLAKVKSITEQKMDSAQAKPMILENEVEFKNYRINTGDALKYFLGSEAKSNP